MLENLNEEARAFIFKIIIPALVAVSVKLAVMGKQGKITFFQVISSFVTGIGSAYLAGPIVMQYTTPNSMPLVIAAIAISGEKIGHYFIYKFKVEEVFKGILERYIKK
jgi:hypothetical protein